MSNTNQHNGLTWLTIEISKHSEGYVGQVKEIPSIVVDAKTRKSLRGFMRLAIEGYFKTYPEAIHQFIKENEIVV